MHSPEPPGVDVLGGRWGWVGIGRDRLDINDAFYVFVALPMRSSRGRIVVRVVRAWPLFRFNSLQSRRRYRGLVANCGAVPDIMYLIGTKEDGRGKHKGLALIAGTGTTHRRWVRRCGSSSGSSSFASGAVSGSAVRVASGAVPVWPRGGGHGAEHETIGSVAPGFLLGWLPVGTHPTSERPRCGCAAAPNHFVTGDEMIGSSDSNAIGPHSSSPHRIV